MNKSAKLTACLTLALLALCARPAAAQITKVADDSGRNFFVNANPAPAKLASATKSRTNIYLPSELSLTGRSRPAMDVDRDGVEKLVREAVDAGVKYLRTLLERYNGNLDLALAAYNAGEGAVDRAHGVPSYRETRNYVQKVQNAYFRPGSGRMPGAFANPHAIHRDVSPEGRIIFTND